MTTVIETHIVHGLTPLGLLIVSAAVAVVFITAIIVLAPFSRRRK